MPTEVVEVEGHIIDSLILAKVLDVIVDSGADYRIVDVEIRIARELRGDDTARVTLVTHDADVQRLFVEEHADVRLLGGRPPFKRLTLSERANRRRGEPVSFVEVAVDADGPSRAPGRGHGCLSARTVRLLRDDHGIARPQQHPDQQSDPQAVDDPSVQCQRDS